MILTAVNSLANFRLSEHKLNVIEISNNHYWSFLLNFSIVVVISGLRLTFGFLTSQETKLYLFISTNASDCAFYIRNLF